MAIGTCILMRCFDFGVPCFTTLSWTSMGYANNQNPEQIPPHVATWLDQVDPDKLSPRQSPRLSSESTAYETQMQILNGGAILVPQPSSNSESEDQKSTVTTNTYGTTSTANLHANLAVPAHLQGGVLGSYPVTDGDKESLASSGSAADTAPPTDLAWDINASSLPLAITG